MPTSGLTPEQHVRQWALAITAPGFSTPGSRGEAAAIIEIAAVYSDWVLSGEASDTLLPPGDDGGGGFSGGRGGPLPINDGENVSEQCERVGALDLVELFALGLSDPFHECESETLTGNGRVSHSDISGACVATTSDDAAGAAVNAAVPSGAK